MSRLEAVAGGAGFTGTQQGMTPDQKRVFRKLIEVLGPVNFHHGDCMGADYNAHLIARELGMYIVLHPPKNQMKRAFCDADIEREAKEYLDRNHDIVDDSDIMFATPSGPEVLRSGTWATIRYARKKGKPLFIIYPDGHIENK